MRGNGSQSSLPGVICGLLGAEDLREPQPQWRQVQGEEV